MTYVVISLVASVLFLLALAFTYAATGTVNLADLAGRIAELPDGLRAALAALLLVVFGIKAALFPLYFWLPDSYPTAPAAVTAIFAGLLTKVGVYAIIRTQTLLFGDDSRPQTLILVTAGLTMVVGILGAIAQEDLKRIFSFYIVSQIGYIVMGLGLFTVAGLAGAVYAIVHHIVLKTALFLAGGLVEQTTGTSRLNTLGGLVRTSPIVAVLFLLPALSLAGIPPFSGFVAKFGIFDATAEASEWTILAVGVLVGLLTLFSIFKVWVSVFWSPAQAAPEPARSPDVDQEGVAVTPPNGPPMMVLPTAVLAVATLAIGVAAGPLYQYSERAAADLLDPAGYLRAVLGG
jgi:multicomponent Na+:H+ antiporter subunit D